MQREKQRILTLAAVGLLIATCGVVVPTKYDQPSRVQPTMSTHEVVRVEFVNDSSLVVHGNVERVGIGTTWDAPDGIATSYFEYGPMNGTTHLDVPKEGRGTTITYVTVYDSGNGSPILTVRNPTTNSSRCDDPSPTQHSAPALPQ